jgi:hypothetical protein
VIGHYGFAPSAGTVLARTRQPHKESALSALAPITRPGVGIASASPRLALHDRAAATPQRLGRIAQQHGPIAPGSLQIPDLRLEVETPAGDLTRVDLELATEHCRPDHLLAKAHAGFALYASAAPYLRAVLETRDLIVEILSR